MRAEHILHKVLGEVAGLVHRARFRAVVEAVLALIDGGEVALSALGRSFARTSDKHGIKRCDRLLGNRALADEVELFYRAIAAYLLRFTKRPVILLDWTEAGHTMCALSAAVPVQGRAIVIHTMTLPLSKWTSRVFEDLFLRQLQAMLGGRTPILVGDAGFRAPWMQSVQAMGWDFVARVRGRTKLRRVGDDAWQPWTTWWAKARRTPRALGAFHITKHRSVASTIVAVDERSARARSKTVRPRRKVQLRSVRAHREPLFLATTLDRPAKEVAAIYATRMQIELAFRDLKSHRFGWGFEDARCRTVSRVAIQVLLASLASLVCMLVGIAVEDANLQKRFQANTTTQRRVLSLVALGRRALKSHACFAKLPIPDLRSRLPFVGIP